MPQRDELSDCPRCAEPLEPGDLFCCACGTALPAAVSREPRDGRVPARPPASAPLPRGVATPAAAPHPPPTPAATTEDLPTLHLNGSTAAARTPPLPDRAPSTVTAGSGPAPAARSGASGERPASGAFPSPGASPSQAAPQAGAGQAGAAQPEGPGGTSAGHHVSPTAADSRGPAAPGPPPAPPAARAQPEPGESGAARADQPPAPAGPTGPAEGTGKTGATGQPGRVGARCVACGTGFVGPEGYCDHCGHAQPRERDHMEREVDGVAAASDRGRRHHRNEDFFWISATALPDGSPAAVSVVCDGVSSATRPDEASATAAESAGAALLAALTDGTEPRPAMRQALLTAAEAVNALATDEERSAQQNAPACTIVSAVVTGEQLTVGWIGDSRAYWVPERPEGRGTTAAPPARLTEDDSWAAQMVAAGLMSEEEAYADPRAHAITGWLGADAYEVEPHTVTFTPGGAGVVVVCTDGLWNYAESATELSAALPSDPASRPLRTARHLVGYALDGGGHDNVTVAVMPFPATTGRPGNGAS